jgi:hypothetical protein
MYEIWGYKIDIYEDLGNVGYDVVLIDDNLKNFLTHIFNYY